MKKILLPFAILILSVILISISGCNPELVSPQNPLGDKGLAGQQKAEEVMGYLKTGDSESLKAMFCNELKKGTDFDAQISKAVSFIDGEIISYNIGGGSGGRGKNWEELAPTVYSIKTDKDKCYTLILSFYIENEDENKLGMHEFSLWLEDGSEDTENGIGNDDNRVLIYTE